MGPSSFQSLLTTLTEALRSSSGSLPDPNTILPPPNGISLLDTKNELFLSYLQNLVFLIIVKLRDARVTASGIEIQDGIPSQNEKITKDVVQKLVELRIYLEKGVKPLEKQLRYQIDKVIRAADDAATVEKNRQRGILGVKAANVKGKQATTNGKDESSDSASDSHSDEDEGNVKATPTIDPLSYRPNPAAFAPPSDEAATEPTAKDGIYRPPRITPVSMPTTTSSHREQQSRVMKSSNLDRFIEEELSTAPIAQPSIGTTISAQGRRVNSQKEREVERERTRYEEENFIRLPAESKKERKKKAQRGGRDELGGYGGEDWLELGRGADRVLDGVKRRGDSGVLERSRKRGFEGGEKGEYNIGERFEKRRKGVQARIDRRKK